MSAFPSLPLFTDAFIADTGHLTAHETGAYLMLLMVAWRSSDCRLPDDDAKLARWARVDLRSWKRTKPAVMAFWSLSEGFWTQKRLLSEALRVRKFAESSRRNGKAGGRPKSLKDNEPENPAGSVEQTQSKAPNSNPIKKEEEQPNGCLSETSSDASPKKTRQKSSYSADFEEFWSGYPTDPLMSKKQAWEVWSRMAEDRRKMATGSLPAFRAYCRGTPDYRPVHANRYLSQERYVGFNAIALQAAQKVFVARGTRAWDAWQAVAKTPCTMSQDHRREGWWFDAEWPTREANAA